MSGQAAIGKFFEFLSQLPLDPQKKAEICQAVVEVIEETKIGDISHFIQEVKRQGIRFELQEE